MALDSVELDALAAGDDVATDLIAAKHYQYMKPGFGAAGTFNEVTSTATNPLPVALSDTDNAVLDAIVAAQLPDSHNVTVDNGAGASAVNIQDGGNVITVDGTVTANPASGTIDTVTSLTQMNGAAISMGTGVRAAGTQRVTIATNDLVPISAAALPLPSGAATSSAQLADGHGVAATLGAETSKVIGTVRMASGGVASGAFASGALAAGAVTDLPLPSGAATSANQLPSTSGGLSIHRNIDVDETEDAVKVAAGQIYWIHCINFDATPVYLHFYDFTVANTTVGSTTPLVSFPVPSQGDANGAGFTMAFPAGIPFATAITVAATTTVGGAGGPATNEVILNLGYK